MTQSFPKRKSKALWQLCFGTSSNRNKFIICLNKPNHSPPQKINLHPTPPQKKSQPSQQPHATAAEQQQQWLNNSNGTKNRSGDWKMKGKAFAESGWRDYIEEEMVCDIAGDMLMSPERARQLLLGSGNITTMRRVKDTIQNWIRDALDRLPSKSVKDPANIKKLRKAWKDTYDALERAYAETVKAVEAEKARLGLNSEKRASKIQGLEHRSEAYIEDEVRGYIDDVLGDLGSDIKITGVKVIGSRAEGRAREDSDLDVLVEYEGNAREDDLFNALNGEDNKLVIDGIPVDINPITPGKSGSIAEFMERNAGFEKGGDAYEGERRYSFSKTKEEFDRTRARAVNENGIVMPGLADKTVKIVHAQPHNFAGVSPIKQAEDWAKENIVGVHTLTDNEGNQHDYTISRNAVGKFLSQSATRKSDSLAAHLSVLRHLPEVIAESIEAEVHPDYLRGDDGRRHTELATNNDRLVHRFYGAVEIGGKTYRVKTTINESRGDETNKPHSYEVTKIELIDGNTINQFQEPISPHDVPTIGVAKLLQGVEKSYDSGKKLLEESEKSAKTTGNGSEKRMSLGGMAREGLSVGVHKVLQVRGPEVERTVRDYETGEERAIMDEGRWRIEGMPGEFGSREDAVAAFRSFALGTRWDVTEDGDIMVYGEGDNYEAMVNRRGEREDARRERWRRQEQRAGGRQVLELMRRLGVSVTFVDMMSPRERAQLSRRQQRAKGWYDPRTGRVYINLSRHSRGDDVVATFLHEVVARKGLRELFGKDFDTFLNNVFNNVSEDIRKEIVEMASRRDWDSLTATEEYLALLAQSTDFDDARNRKVWSKVINYFMDLLRKVGITLNRPLTDNELRYILWRSYNRMEQRGVMGLADDMVMRDKLDIDSVLSVADDEASTEMQRLAADAVRRESESSERPQLDENAIDELIETATAQAIPMPNPIELSRENWDKEFPGGVLDTPLGNVKLSDGQYKKTIDLKRKDDISMIKPTLTDPDFIVSVPSEAKNGQVTERPSSYLFIKCFVGKNGEKVYFFKSVTNKKDGLEINMSNHIDRPKRVKRGQRIFPVGESVVSRI